MRLIDADALSLEGTITDIVEEILNAPTAEPNKRGRWESIPLNVENDKYGMNKYNMRIKCTNCGFVTSSQLKYAYCPNCGAKMEV